MFRRLLVSSASLLCTFAFIAQTEAANRYWVGTTNRWETTANWAATSGGAGGQSVPSSSDIAIFDGGGSSDVLLRSAVTVQGLLLASTTGKTVTVGTGSFVIGSSNLRVGAGTLRGTGRPLRVTGSVTQTGGFIIEMSSSVSISGSLVIQDSTFASTGTLIFSGNANQNFTVDNDSTLITGGTVQLRNTGSAGSNNIIVDCDTYQSGVCYFGGAFTNGANLTITSGNLDLDTNTNSLILLDGNITVANSSSASIDVGNATLLLSGSLAVGLAGGLTVDSDGSLTFAGTGHVTLDLQNKLLAGGLLLSAQESIDELNSCPTLTLSSNIRISGSLVLGEHCTVNLGTSTLAATGATVLNIGTVNLNTGMYVVAATGLGANDSTYSSSLTSVGIGNRMYMSIQDSSRNLVGTSIESLTMTLATSEGDSETLTLPEAYTNGYFGVSPIYGYFRESIGTASEQAVHANDGVLQLVGDSTTVTISYTDPVDGLSNTTSVVLSRSTSSSSSSSQRTGGGGGGGSRIPSVNPFLPNTSSSSSVSSTSSTSSSSSAGMFKDVPERSWFAAFVMKLMDLGIVSGYKDSAGNLLHEFRPAHDVTYAEVAKMAAEAASLSPLSGASMNTSDDGQWSEGYIALLESKQISVFQNHALDVNTSASRGAVVQILLETFAVSLDATENPYSDVPSFSPFARAILQATHDGIVSGDDGETTFRPEDAINRAETSKMVLKALETYGR